MSILVILILILMTVNIIIYFYTGNIWSVVGAGYSLGLVAAMAIVKFT